MEKTCQIRLDEITEKFKACRKAFSAMGDETRQLILLALLDGDFNGIRVGEISKKIHLSRPAVSHHLQVLREAEIVNVRREGTRNYYYLDSNESRWKILADLMSLVCSEIQAYAGTKQTGDNDPRKAQ